MVTDDVIGFKPPTGFVTVLGFATGFAAGMPAGLDTTDPGALEATAGLELAATVVFFSWVVEALGVDVGTAFFTGAPAIFF